MGAEPSRRPGLSISSSLFHRPMKYVCTSMSSAQILTPNIAEPDRCAVVHAAEPLRRPIDNHPVPRCLPPEGPFNASRRSVLLMRLHVASAHLSVSLAAPLQQTPLGYIANALYRGQPSPDAAYRLTGEHPDAARHGIRNMLFRDSREHASQTSSLMPSYDERHHRVPAHC